MDIIIKIIQFFLCFTILVGIHELGHFLMARVFRIRVDKFYIFFDPWFSIFKFKRGDTEYGLGWLPLGGYCKIAGMIDESMDKEQMKQPPKPDEFRTKPAWQRFLVMIAGVVMNVVLAVAIYIGICYTWGDTYFSNADAKWGYNFNEAGHKLGFHDGDRLVSIDGEEADDINKVVNSLIITESDGQLQIELPGMAAAWAAAAAPSPATSTCTSPPQALAAVTVFRVAPLMEALSCSAITSTDMMFLSWTLR